MKKHCLLPLSLMASLLPGGCATDVERGVSGGPDGPMAIFITGPNGAE